MLKKKQNYIKKLGKLLLIVIKLVNKIDMSEFVVLKMFGEESKEFSFWLREIIFILIF